MEWKIVEHQDGSVQAMYGIQSDGGPNPMGIGYIMPGFFTYYESNFENKKAAERYIKKYPDPLKTKR